MLHCEVRVSATESALEKSTLWMYLLIKASSIHAIAGWNSSSLKVGNTFNNKDGVVFDGAETLEQENHHRRSCIFIVCTLQFVCYQENLKSSWLLTIKGLLMMHCSCILWINIVYCMNKHFQHHLKTIRTVKQAEMNKE